MSNPFAADPSAVRGAMTPLVTPFSADGSVDLDAIGPLVDWQLQQGQRVGVPQPVSRLGGA